MTSAKSYVLEGAKTFDQLNPKELLLLAGATCAGMTAMAILDKQRVEIERLRLVLSGMLDTETLESKSVFTSFDLSYMVVAEPTVAVRGKVQRAVALAHEQYCGAVRMLGRVAPVAHRTLFE